MASSGNFVGYDLYSDTGYADLLEIGDEVDLQLSDGTEKTVNLYGKATGKAGLPAGSYSDTISVVLTF